MFAKIKNTNAIKKCVFRKLLTQDRCFKFHFLEKGKTKQHYENHKTCKKHTKNLSHN